MTAMCPICLKGARVLDGVIHCEDLGCASNGGENQIGVNTRAHLWRCHPKGRQYSPEVHAARLEHANTVYGWFTGVANEHGYAITRHGSHVRDIDLVAIPWTDAAISATELVLKLMAAFGLTMGSYSYDKPHGRAAFAMWTRDWPDHQIDLSIMPTKTA